MTTPVTHYGLHTSEEGVVYLHQGRGADNFIGLKAPSPFHVELRKAWACPHLINKSAPVPDIVHWEQFSRILGDQLVQAMLPVPRQREELIPYLSDPQNQLALILITLSRMSSPIYSMVKPFNSMTQLQVMKELALTNVAPLVLTGLQTENQRDVEEMAREARLMPRRLILTGDPNLVIRTPLTRIQTTLWEVDELKLAGLPMESLGALLLRRYARNERLDTPLVRGNHA
jgi:hypothetical protein